MAGQKTLNVNSHFWSDSAFRRLVEMMPAAAYTCDAEGLITSFNERAVELWGRAPKLQDPMDRY